MNRILHVVYQMDPGGTETWLMHMLRQSKRTQFAMDFLVHTSKQCAYDCEIRKLGSRLFAAPHPSHVWAHGRFVRSILRSFGPYAAVHVHCHLVASQLLCISAHEKVPVRILHSHSAKFGLPHGLLGRAWWQVARATARRYATIGLACSDLAARAMFGAAWKNDLRWRVLPCGLDFSAFAGRGDREEVRHELGIPPRARVIGHVGRFHTTKNHRLIVEIAVEAVRRDPHIHLLLVGDGPLRSDTERAVARAGLQSHVTFAGLRNDVPRLMTAAMDTLLLPSLHEGLGLVLVEAQAAGLPCVCSNVIPREAEILPQLITRLSLFDSAALWADSLHRILSVPRPVDWHQALNAVLQSRYNLLHTISELEHVYTQSTKQNIPVRFRAA